MDYERWTRENGSAVPYPPSLIHRSWSMAAIARFMQLAGLVLPPLAIIAELNHTISLGQMLGFLVVSICLFSLGYVLKQYTGGAGD